MGQRERFESKGGEEAVSADETELERERKSSNGYLAVSDKGRRDYS